MKYKYYTYILFSIILVGSFLLNGCNYLDYHEGTPYTGRQVWNDRYRVRDALVGIYGDLGAFRGGHDREPIGGGGGAMRAMGIDDGYANNTFNDVHKMTDGRWSATNTVDDQWQNYYEVAYRAFNFLDHFSLDSLHRRQYNNNYDDIRKAWLTFPYQTRFLLGFVYFRLLKRYGGNIPLVKDTLNLENVNHVKNAPYDSIVHFVVAQCDSGIFGSPGLPVDYHDMPFKETGRATKGAAKALKAKVLLFAASKRNNPNDDIDKWIDAAKAAKDIIDDGTYSLDANYSNVFNNINASGAIWTWRYKKSNFFEKQNYPIGFEGANKNSQDPTQNLVDAYEMKKTGLPITDPASGYDPKNPYKGRDPRLEKTIIVNDSKYKGRDVEIWKGGKDGPQVEGASVTGYYLKKGVDEGLSLIPPNVTTAYHSKVVFRYGYVLLNYAEAMNEAFGPDNTGPGTLDMTARDAVDKIRERVSMPDFPIGMSKAEFRQKLRNERRVETAFENQRFWDLRRWETPPALTIKGMKISRNVNGTFSYHVKTVDQRVWDNKMFYYPIPQDELFKNDNLEQRPGWE